MDPAIRLIATDIAAAITRLAAQRDTTTQPDVEAAYTQSIDRYLHQAADILMAQTAINAITGAIGRGAGTLATPSRRPCKIPLCTSSPTRDIAITIRVTLCEDHAPTIANVIPGPWRTTDEERQAQ